MKQIHVNHDQGGNCTHKAVTFSCIDCGDHILCEICHVHDEPRGECGTCPECYGCWRDLVREEAEQAWCAVIDDCNDWKKAWKHARHAINGEWP